MCTCMMMTSLSKTNIKEANEHLKQLHQRIYDLETQLQLHALHMEDLQKNNIELQRQLSVVKSEKNELRKQLKEKDSQLETLLSSADEKDKTLMKLEAKSRLFHEVVEHRFSLQRILQVLDEVGEDNKSHDQSTSLSNKQNSIKEKHLMNSVNKTEEAY